MAETTEKVKKPRAAAKPRAPRTAGTTKAAAKKTDGAAVDANDAVATKAALSVPTHDEIAMLAQQYWNERGRQHGEHLQDWLRAEQDLMKMAS
jgi:hypothetical protein